jgi:CcmD family protein
MCKKDEANIPFLTAAYLALWAILLVFFLFVAVRQKRMRAEMEMLRERLARLGEEGR